MSSLWDHTVLPATRQRGNIPVLTPAEAGTRSSDPEGVQGWGMQDLSTALRCSPCPRLHVAAAVAINTTARGEIRTSVLSHRSQTR